MDDYQSDSFRLWLRKKYTGPYIHENPWETKERCQKEAADIVAYCDQARKTNEVDSKLSPEEWCLSVFDGNPFELLEPLSLHIDAKTDENNDILYFDEYGVQMNEDELEMYTDRQSSLEWASTFGWKEKLQIPKDMF